MNLRYAKWGKCSRCERWFALTMAGLIRQHSDRDRLVAIPWCAGTSHREVLRGKEATPMKDKAIGYVRVSTQEQVASGGGLDIQRDAVRDYAKGNDLRLVAILSDEGISGSNGLDTRTGLGEALRRLEEHEATVLVVYRLDRLARDLMVQETTIARLRDAGAAVQSVTEDDVDSQEPTRVLVRQILGAIGEYEGALIRARMRAGREAKRTRGGWLGGAVPYGYRPEGAELVPEPFEQEGINLARSLRAADQSLRQIGKALVENGFPPKRSSHWSPTAVRSLLS